MTDPFRRATVNAALAAYGDTCPHLRIAEAFRLDYGNVLSLAQKLKDTKPSDIQLTTAPPLVTLGSSLRAVLLRHRAIAARECLPGEPIPAA